MMQRWLGVLAQELAARLADDRQEFGRWPKNLGEATGSKTRVGAVGWEHGMQQGCALLLVLMSLCPYVNIYA